MVQLCVLENILHLFSAKEERGLIDLRCRTYSTNFYLEFTNFNTMQQFFHLQITKIWEAK